MKKSFIIAAFAAFTLVACNTNEKKSSDNTDQVTPVETANQDSIDKAHGHSHDPSGNHTAPAAKADSSTVAPLKQDSIDKAHGHKH